ncbi:MAG: hypothetical protein AAB914_02875 [Patescibacteria group bacterium]
MSLNSINQKEEQRTVSISRARRILGKKYEKLTDDQVRDILTTLHLLARQNLGYNSSKKVRTYEQSTE